MENQATLAQAAAKLRAKHVKNTPQRQVILSYLMTSKEHPSIKMIHEHVAANGFKVSLATVYNTLEILQEKELIIQVAADSDGHMRYDYYQKPHYHVICVRCNKIIDVFHDGFQAIEQDAAQATGFKVYNSQCEVYGLCPDCQAELAK
ncbi:MAG: Fur family transcriptional regulator [Ligilactobacillus saerimneri]|nr:Fur family transcriptional regulator [Ligilactobacillus saerimneri]